MKEMLLGSLRGEAEEVCLEVRYINRDHNQ